METWQSETGRITSMALRHARDAFRSQEAIDDQWKQLNYLDRVSFDNAVAEHEAFIEILKSQGIDLLFIENTTHQSLDSIYVRDASIATGRGMIICNPGKSNRIPEAGVHKEFYRRHNIPVLGEINPPGTLEGGDLVWLNSDVIAVGRGYRTNEGGISQLKNLVKNFVEEVVVFHSPHYKGPSDVFHLMSVFSPVAANLAVVYSPLMPVSFRELLISRGITLIEVPDHEFETLGCNVLALAPNVCLMVKGNKETKAKLEKTGVQVIEYSGTDISIKGCGGPTCLTRPLVREL